MKLYNSDTTDRMTAKDLGVTAEEYRDLIRESKGCSQAEGHVRAPNGTRVYAA